MNKLGKKTMKKMPYVLAIIIFFLLSTMQLYGVALSVASQVMNQSVKAPATLVTSASTVCTPDDTGDNLVPDRIIMKNAQIDLPVVSVKLNQGTWQVYDGVANYAVETSKISAKTGNVGIFGHDRANAFSNIKKLKKGDLIEVKSGQDTAVYAVTSMNTVDPNNVQAFYPTSKPTLTLITCDGVFSEQRYMLKANLVSIKKGNCNEKTI